MRNMLRTALALAFLIGVIIAAGDLFHANNGSSYIPFAIDPTGVSDLVEAGDLRHVRVTGDVRTGDTLRLGEPKMLLRLGTFSYPARATFTDLRTGRAVALEDLSAQQFSYAPRRVTRLVLLVIALALLLFRGREAAAIGLSAYLFITEFSLAAGSAGWLGVWGAVGYDFLQLPLNLIASACLVFLAWTFARRDRIANVLAYLGFAFAAICVVLEIASFFASLLYGLQWDIESHNEELAQIVMTIIALVIFLRAVRTAEVPQRRRVLILAGATVIGSADTVIGLFGASNFSEFQENLTTAAEIVMAIGLVYAIVVERLFDIAFVINRAVVYGVTSGIVVLAFVAIEWIVGRTATSFSHFDSAALQLGLAIVVALSLRPIHSRVDSFVDSAIFAARHRSANALLRFADDCSEFRSEQSLFSATLDALVTHARVSACTVYLTDEEGDLVARASGADMPPLSGDDPAVVRMRTSRSAVSKSNFPQLKMADIVFPMLRRRSLIGAIACTLPGRAEPYSPEECAALTTVAREVGASLVALEAASAKRLEAEVAELRASLLLGRV